MPSDPTKMIDKEICADGGQEEYKELPAPDDVDVEPRPPSCEKITSYMGWRGRYGFHRCSCCGRLYAVDIEDNVQQFERDGGTLVIRDSKTHDEIESSISRRVRR